VLNKKEEVPSQACGGRETIAIRCPRHPVAQQLLERFGNPISAPSANKSGYISPTTASHVDEEFNREILVLDGGPCEEGIESTVISLVGQPTILRLGSVTQTEIEGVIGSVLQSTETTQTDSPGTSLQHYAPHTDVRLMQTSNVNKINDCDCIALVLHGNPICAKHCIQMPKNPTAYGVAMYSALREADQQGVSCIAIEQPPLEIDWKAIQDRLMRCSATPNI
jgi:L-threonylcarbamoyladenylate synthase